MYTAKQRLHLTADGKVVPKGHPKSKYLLVPKGGTLSDAEAARYGLPGSEPKQEAPADVLPLEPQPHSANVGLVTDNSENFPKQINFGNVVIEAGTVSPPAPAPVTVAAATEPEPAPAATAPPTESQPDLPEDFPSRDLLIRQGFGTKEKVISATKDQLLALDQIGVSRADEILAAAVKLNTT